jgi:hypothetical protein
MGKEERIKELEYKVNNLESWKDSFYQRINDLENNTKFWVEIDKKPAKEIKINRIIIMLLKRLRIKIELHEEEFTFKKD